MACHNTNDRRGFLRAGARHGGGSSVVLGLVVVALGLLSSVLILMAMI
jgi:hypothetical protein